MELATDEPRMNVSRQFDHFAQIGPRCATGDDQALGLELGQQRVVDLVAMTMALGNFGAP
jgi:hypothetical protein